MMKKSKQSVSWVCTDTGRKSMAKLFAAWGTYDLPEILCIRGKKCHEVTQGKERMIQHHCLQENNSWANFHHGHKEHGEGQSHIFPLSHPNSLLSTCENKWACPIAWDKHDINLVILHDLQSQRFSAGPKWSFSPFWLKREQEMGMGVKKD